MFSFNAAALTVPQSTVAKKLSSLITFMAVPLNHEWHLDAYLALQVQGDGVEFDAKHAPPVCTIF